MGRFAPGFMGGMGGGIDEFVKLMLHFDGADASTTFTDSSASGHTLSAVGNAQIDTAQSKFGGASCLFDGTNDGIDLPTSTDWVFDGDVTIDCWVRPSSVSAQRAIWSFDNSSSFGIFNGVLAVFATGFGSAIAGGTISADVWQHVALQRSGTTAKLFVGGVQVAVDTEFGSSSFGDNIATRIGLTSAGETDYAGHIDELRISKGIARYTTSFTPPARAYS